MTDVRLYQTNDGGEIDYDNGLAVTADGLETAAYLSLFGGNKDDDGGDAGSSLQWWGNFTENEPSRQYRSRTQYLLNSIPAVSANLLRIEDAAVSDLEWFVEEGVANDVGVLVTIPALNAVNIEVNIEIGDSTYEFNFEQEWALT